LLVGLANCLANLGRDVPLFSCPIEKHFGLIALVAWFWVNLALRCDLCVIGWLKQSHNLALAMQNACASLALWMQQKLAFSMSLTLAVQGTT